MYRYVSKTIFERIIEKITQFDWLFFSLICMLICVGLLTIHSIDISTTNYLYRHFLRISFSLILFLIVSFINIKFWYRFAYVFYFLIIAMLIYVYFFGLSALGAQRWINLYFFNIQPSELMKVGVILALARYYQYIKLEDIDRFSKLITPIFIIILPFFLVASQPDLGTGIFILLVCMGMLWLAGLSLKIFITSFISLLVIAPFLIYFLKPYQKKES